MHIFVLSSLLVIAGFSKSEFFQALSGSNSMLLEKMINKIDNSAEGMDQLAYLGAIKMKYAEFQKTPMEKLGSFKEGKNLLEKAITKMPNKAEYRFLRLMIQENAPKILNYKDNIKEDVRCIANGLNALPSEVKSAVTTYAKTSKNLKI